MKVFYDSNNVRYTLKATHAGEINFLFVPGGPGCDSRYLDTLIEALGHLPGNVWFIDFPGNGDHTIQMEDFDNWLSIFIPTVSGFKNPVLVGHSFGGMIPLLFSECEDLLSGLIILNSAPCLWLEAALKVAHKNSLPDLSVEMKDFTETPNQLTFNAALNACVPYYFPPITLEKGRKLLSAIPFAFGPAVWWQRKAIEIEYNAVWIPQSVPTLIIGAEFDAICPFELYAEDNRFNRKNIDRIFMQGAGHFPWVEKPEEICKVFKNFTAKF